MAQFRFALAGLALIVGAAAIIATQDVFEDPSVTQLADQTGAVVVSRVIDGDTFVATAAGAEVRVRIIGINTPELGRNGSVDECYAVEARTLLEEMIGGQAVTLSNDPTQSGSDRYGRLLRHVAVDGHDVAVVLLSQGAGREYRYDRDYVGRTDHIRAEAKARSSEAGLWSQCQ
ncbi:thermonuclease family protein [Leucobacter sp. GX0328]